MKKRRSKPPPKRREPPMPEVMYKRRPWPPLPAQGPEPTVELGQGLPEPEPRREADRRRG